jgi:hypothetical protein
LKHLNIIGDHLEFVSPQSSSKKINALKKKELDTIQIQKTRSVGNLLPKVEEQKNEEEKKSIYHKLNLLKDFDEFNLEDKKDLAKLRSPVVFERITENDCGTIEEIIEKEVLEKININHQQAFFNPLGKSPIVNLKVDEIDDKKEKSTKRFQEEDDDEEHVEVIEEEQNEGNMENTTIEKGL